MDRTGTQWTIREGDEVYGSDDAKVGKVAAVHPNHVVVEKGFFFPTDSYIPMGAVSNYEDGKAYLTVTKDQALDQGWDAEPGGGAEDGGALGGVPGGAGAGATAHGGVDHVHAQPGGGGYRHAGEDHAEGAAEHRVVAGDVVHAADQGSLRVPVHEEELTATKRARAIGEVRVEKDVVAEERTLEVPVTEERVRVERRVVDRPGTDGGAFEGGTIAVPIRGEEVELQKRVRVAEEVEFGKEAVERTEQVGGTVRREEVRVTEADATRGSER